MIVKKLMKYFLPPAEVMVAQEKAAWAALVVPFSTDKTLMHLPKQGELITGIASKLYLDGWAERVGVMGGYPNINGESLSPFVEADLARHDLSDRYVPVGDIFSEKVSANTVENAQYILPVCKVLDCPKDATIILVVNALQSGRAYRTFDAVFRLAGYQIRFLVVPVQNLDPETWKDSAKWWLRSPLRFMIREIAVRLYYRTRKWI